MRAAVQRVPAAPGTPAENLDQPPELAALARERELLDIHADGTRVLAPRVDWAERQKALRFQWWEERHDAAPAPPASAPADALAALRAAYHLAAPTPAPAPAPGAAAPRRPGTIAESEFAPLHDQMMQQLDVALFHAEQAQNLLGMLLQQGRRDSATVLAAQSEYFLEPSSLSLSLLAAALPDESLDTRAPRSPALVLAVKRASLQRTSRVLSDGAAELRACLAPERARWRALRQVQQRGWKLTPGRPLVDMERLDVPSQHGSALQGFGLPVMQGDGSVKEEGARDAWIGYGPSEAPLAVLQRTLAYCADADAGTAGDGAEGATLSFPDRAWRRLRVEIHETTDDGRHVWASETALPQGGDLDTQLYDAQLDAVDSELFRELVAHAGTLSAALPRTASATSLELPLGAHIALHFTMVPYGPDAPPPDAEPVPVHPWPTLLLYVLRLRMLRGWTRRVAALRSARATSVTGPPPPPRTTITTPLWELYEYILYLMRLRALLDDVIATHNAQHASAATLDWQPYDGINDVHAWLTAMLDVAQDAEPTSTSPGGHVLVLVDGTYVYGH